MIKTTVCITFLFACLIFKQNQDSVIKWNKNRKLEFKDFSGEIVKSSPYFAISSNQFYFDYSIKMDTLDYNVFAFFEPDSSWIKLNDTSLLNHEQRHFDIAEIACRKIKKQLHSLSFREIDDSIVYNLFMIERQNSIRTDSMFDTETRHGQNEKENKKWDKKIEKMLDSLETYKDPRGKIVIKPKEY